KEDDQQQHHRGNTGGDKGLLVNGVTLVITEFDDGLITGVYQLQDGLFHRFQLLEEQGQGGSVQRPVCVGPQPGVGQPDELLELVQGGKGRVAGKQVLVAMEFNDLYATGENVVAKVQAVQDLFRNGGGPQGTAKGLLEAGVLGKELPVTPH